MPTVTGVVQKVMSFATKTGGKMYSLKVNDNLYGCGSTFPSACSEGDFIEFEATQRGQYTNADVRSIKVVRAAAAAEAGKSVGNSPVTGNTAETYQNREVKKQDAISKQAARNTAVAFMTLLRDQEALPMAASAKSPKARFDILINVLDELTDRFYKYASGIEDNAGTEAKSENDSMVEEAGNDRPWTE